MTDTCIAVSHLVKSFGDKRVFEDLSLEVQRGETLAIVGGSGCGKSVLLRMMVGLVAPDSGSLRFRDTELAGSDEKAFRVVRHRVSMLFQGSALFDSLTVAENLAYPIHAQRLEVPEGVERRIADTLALVGLTGTESLLPAALSGGMKKRIGLARAIITRPELLLFDEPTAGLDPPNTRRIDDLIRSIHADRQITIILVTHDLPSADLVADRIAMLAERKIVAVLPPAEFRASNHPAIREFVDAMAPIQRSP